MTVDFPAAHSMDSAWFAVDACGHVAAGETGEAGALPEPLQQGVQVRFEGLCFADHPLLQPADHMPCATWYAPYLSADARTIRTQRPGGLTPEEQTHLEPWGAVYDPSPWRPLRERGTP